MVESKVDATVLVHLLELYGLLPGLIAVDKRNRTPVDGVFRDTGRACRPHYGIAVHEEELERARNVLKQCGHDCDEAQTSRALELDRTNPD